MTEAERPFITKEMMLADRRRRDPKHKKNGLSRTDYKNLTGLGESAQVRWEEEDPKKRKDAEYDILAPFIFDATLPPLELGSPEQSSPPPEGAVATEPDATPPAPAHAGVPSEVPAIPPVPQIPTSDAGSEPADVANPFAGAEVLGMASSDTETPEGDGTGQPIDLPVELISGEELDDPDYLAETVITPGSGLPVKVEYARPGYHITNSELQTFKRCRRMWYLAYYREVKLIRPDLTGARAIGTRLHLALQAHYSSRGEDPTEVLEQTIAEDRQILMERGDQQGLDDLEKDADLARIMLEGYLEWVQEEGKDEGYEVVGDEVVVEELLGTAEQFNWDRDVIVMGKMDLRLRRFIDGARFFLDHKSVGSLKEPLKTLHMNEQMLHYHLLEFMELRRMQEERGDSVAPEYARGGLYNMLRKVKRTARANPPFFDRVEVPHNAHELNSYWLRIWGEVTDIIELRKKLDAGANHLQVAYPTPNGNCSWDCDFLSVCNLFDDGSDAERMLGDLYEKGNPHDYYLPYGESAVARQEGTN